MTPTKDEIAEARSRVEKLAAMAQRLVSAGYAGVRGGIAADGAALRVLLAALDAAETERDRLADAGEKVDCDRIERDRVEALARAEKAERQRDGMKERLSMPRFQCSECGSTGPFRDIVYPNTPNGPEEYDMMCVECKSLAVAESPHEAFRTMQEKLDTKVAEAERQRDEAQKQLETERYARAMGCPVCADEGGTPPHSESAIEARERSEPNWEFDPERDCPNGYNRALGDTGDYEWVCGCDLVPCSDAECVHGARLRERNRWKERAEKAERALEEARAARDEAINDVIEIGHALGLPPDATPTEIAAKAREAIAQRDEAIGAHALCGFPTCSCGCTMIPGGCTLEKCMHPELSWRHRAEKAEAELARLREPDEAAVERVRLAMEACVSPHNGPVRFGTDDARAVLAAAKGGDK